MYDFFDISLYVNMLIHYVCSCVFHVYFMYIIGIQTEPNSKYICIINVLYFNLYP